jgi:FHA domain
VVIREGAGAGSEHPVDGELILGREDGSADLVIDDPGVSRCHARLITDAGGVIVEDLGSSNGTYVNGERISGPVEVATGDEVQLGATVLGVERGTAATTLIPPRRAPSRRPAPRRLAPPNLPALAAVFLGPLSILLLLLSAGGFFIALPCAIAAILLGTIGRRNAARRGVGHGGLARIGRFTGMVGTILSLIAIVVFVVVSAALHSTETSVSGLVNRIKDEINQVDVPNAPNVNAPSPSSGGSGSSSGGESGGTSAP